MKRQKIEPLDRKDIASLENESDLRGDILICKGLKKINEIIDHLNTEQPSQNKCKLSSHCFCQFLSNGKVKCCECGFEKDEPKPSQECPDTCKNTNCINYSKTCVIGKTPTEQEWCFKYQCKCSDKEDKSECPWPSPCGFNIPNEGKTPKSQDIKLEGIEKIACSFCTRVYGEPCRKSTERCGQKDWLKKAILDYVEGR